MIAFIVYLAYADYSNGKFFYSIIEKLRIWKSPRVKELSGGLELT